ncbi:DNA integrity scanning protein DisA [Gottschalkia acidurici 9a]|uniref:diadenylate cyclase n=1 Tax=Gottschalkia acidurici (strain ATCC 7906 / DSM 604 / BCRC 14475 / CIP 104303 / KCTC 5404 / NCIMB 10678 / 9a) TaxID=1128398 RepID=K0AZU3_GOTA9|nr:DNA integrity scanning diadenylate cyclase DisA [Gottschalkia acidurici]AFS79318.1 DNA integrity scanning protein DisA [Gottschalkia acidurici 9a]
MREENSKKDSILEHLKCISPGTYLRDGLENIVRAKTGALIVFGDSEEVMDIVDGGFSINSEFTPANIYELAKMDGAIILSEDNKRILFANTQMLPDSSIVSRETGTRHRTAERVAKQTGKLVIAISERRNIITVYKGNHKYVLKDVNEILNKANQAIQTLEKYKVVLNQAMANLSALEFENLVTVFDVTKVLQRTEMVMRVVVEIEKYIIELGNEGRLIEMQLEELTGNTEEDGLNIIRDYYVHSEYKDYNDVNKEIKRLSSDDLLELNIIAKVLGYDDGINSLDLNVHPKGYRILSKIPRLPSTVLENVIEVFGSLQDILKASISELDDVEGIGEIRARSIKEGLRRFQEQSIVDMHI